MKYFVVSDVHGFYKELITALNANGFDANNQDHKLVICGDILDRGKEAVQMQQFVLDLLNKDKVILVKGNHESLMIDMLDQLAKYGDEILFSHRYHVTNGTFDTLLQLTGMTPMEFERHDYKAVLLARETPFIKEIIPHMVDYFETKHYIFVHGWIPCDVKNPTYNRRDCSYSYRDDWRNASPQDWEDARWLNGMELAHYHKVVEPNKTIVCGHYHCSYGWAHIQQERKEFPPKNRAGWEKSFEPYQEDGVIAIDACTAYSGIVNCLVLED